MASTLLEECAAIHAAQVEHPEDCASMRAVFRRLASEILAHHHRASARDIARILLEDAGVPPIP